MSVGVALLQGAVSSLENKTTSAALAPSVVTQQVVDLATSLLGMVAMGTVALKRINVFPNDPNLMIIAIALCVISSFISLYELFIQANFLLMVMTSEGPTVPRLLAMLYPFLQDLRFWVIFSLFSHCILALLVPQNLTYTRRPVLGWLILVPAGLAPLVMTAYGIAVNGIGFYFEETSLAEFFLFPAYSIPAWAYWIVDGVMVTELMVSLIALLSKCFDSFRCKRKLADEEMANFRAASMVFVYVVYLCIEKPAGFFILASSWGSHQTITTNLYSLLLPLQLIYFHWRSPLPAKLISAVTVRPEETEEMEMVPFEGGMKDPLLVEWNAAYDRYMEEKRRAAAARLLPSTRV